MSVKKVPVALAGFGHIGKAFAALMAEKADAVRLRYELDLRLVAVLRKRGAVVDEGGFTGPVPAVGSAGWTDGLTAAEVLGRGERGVLADCTPSSIRTGEPGLGILRAALAAGWHVATAGKGPLVLDYAGLRDAARRVGVQIRYSAATAAALPTLDVGLLSLAGAEVL
ncbi:MAG: homoserine dehydrogenase, partial [Candidatus Aminicenantes bacterium]|nr:homoserine dehydrogenase [Candidatus Aminicenantes bacterium]